MYTSSVAAIGPAPQARTADETNVWDAGRYAIPYVDSKHEAEVVALRLVARGLPLVIVNPAHVLGAGDPGRSSTALVRRFMRRADPGVRRRDAQHRRRRGRRPRSPARRRARRRSGERYILGNRNFTFDRLFADLGRLSGVEPPALKLPLPVALALADACAASAGRRDADPDRGARVLAQLGVRNRKAKRELGWQTSPHEDCLEETIAWYRERDGTALAPPGARQPLRAAARGRASAGSASGPCVSDGDAVPLHDADQLAVPVRQGRARAARATGSRSTEVRSRSAARDRPEVEALTDQRRVPVLVIDGEAICDSRRIVEHLEYRRTRG